MLVGTGVITRFETADNVWRIEYANKGHTFVYRVQAGDSALIGSVSNQALDPQLDFTWGDAKEIVLAARREIARELGNPASRLNQPPDRARGERQIDFTPWLSIRLTEPKGVDLSAAKLPDLP